jgi:hypothetical protein
VAEDGRRLRWAVVFVVGVVVGVLGAQAFIDGATALGIVALAAAGVVCGLAVSRFDRVRRDDDSATRYRRA